MPPMDTTEIVHMRARSNSAESWEAMNGGFNRRGVRHTWQTEGDDQESKRSSKAKRQDSYLQAVRTQLGSSQIFTFHYYFSLETKHEERTCRLATRILLARSRISEKYFSILVFFNFHLISFIY